MFQKTKKMLAKSNSEFGLFADSYRQPGTVEPEKPKDKHMMSEFEREKWRMTSNSDVEKLYCIGVFSGIIFVLTLSVGVGNYFSNGLTGPTVGFCICSFFCLIVALRCWYINKRYDTAMILDRLDKKKY